MLALLIAAATTSTANAALNFSLVLDDPTQTVGPNEEVDLFATLTNEASSDEPLPGDAYDTSFIVNGTLVGSGNPYRADYGGPGVVLRFELGDLNLAPGESHDFLLATLIPDPGPVPPGTYQSTNAGIQYDLDDDFSTPSTAAATSTITVNVVPEPASIALLAPAGLLALRRRRRRKA